MTATGIIRYAALKSGAITLPNGKTVAYADVATEPTQDLSCWLCGVPLQGQGVPTKAAIKPTFTDANLAAAPHSKHICAACAFCISRRELRNYSILAHSGGLEHPSRAEWRDILLDPPGTPFVACIATSGQRWLTIRAQVAYSRDNYPVQVEDVLVYVDRPRLARLLELVEELYTVFTKDEIRSGEYQPHRIRQFGVSRLEEIESELTKHRGDRLFDLALLVAQKREGE